MFANRSVIDFRWLIVSALSLFLISCAENSSPVAPVAPVAPVESYSSLTLEQLVAEAKQDFKENQFDEALRKTEAALIKNPGFFSLYLSKARILRELGKKQGALDFLSTQIRENPTQSEFIMVRGQFLLEQEYLESAKDDFYSVFDREDKKSLELLLKLIELEQKKENFNQVSFFLDEALQVAPKNAKLWYKKTRTQLRLFQFKQAKTTIKQAIELAPLELAYQQIYVEILTILKEGEALEHQLHLMLDSFPDNDWAGLRLASLWLEQKQFTIARTLLQKILLRSEKNPLVHFQLATIFAGERNWQASLESYLKGLRYRPKTTWVKIQVAKVYINLNDIASSLNYLQQAEEAGTQDLFVYETLAKIYNQQTDTYAAEQVILKGLRISSSNQTLLLEYATLLERRANHKEATRAYEEILKLSPKNHFVQGKLGNLYRIAKQYGKALNILQLAKRQSPEVPWIRALLVELLTEQKQWAEALLEIDEMIRIRDNYYWPHFSRALITQKLGDFSTAHESVTAAIQLAVTAKTPPTQFLKLREVEGEILASLGRYPAAELAFLAALKLAPKDAIILTKLAHTQIFLDRSKALSSIMRAIRIDDFNLGTVEMYLFLTDTAGESWGFSKGSLAEQSYQHILKKDFEAAEILLKRLKEEADPHFPFLRYLRDFQKNGSRITMSPLASKAKAGKNFWHKFYLGISALESDNKQQAKLFFQQGLDLNPDNPWLMVRQASVLENLNEPQQAVVLLETFLTHFPDLKWVQIRLALNYDLSKQYHQSEQVYLKILEKNPKAHIVLNNLAWLYLTTKDPKLKKLDDALALSLKAVKIRPTSANQDTLAEAYFQKKQYQKALKSIEHALDRDRRNLDYFKKQKKKILKAIQEEQKKKENSL